MQTTSNAHRCVAEKSASGAPHRQFSGDVEPIKFKASILAMLLTIAAPLYANADNDLHRLFDQHEGLGNLLQKKIIRLDAQAPPASESTWVANAGTRESTQAAVDPQAAERALERSLTRTGALLLPAGQVELQFSTTYASSQQQQPLLYWYDGQPALALRETRRRDLATNLTARLGLPFDAQLEVMLPYRQVTQSIVTLSDHEASNEARISASMVGDMTAGFAKTLLHERDGRPDVIGRISVNIGNGREQKNSVPIGEGFKKIRSELTVLKRLDPLVFTANFSYDYAFAARAAPHSASSLHKTTIKPGDQFGLSLSALLATSPNTSLSVGIDQAWTKKTRIDGIGIAGSDQVSGMLVVGATSTIGKSAAVAVTVGKGMTRGTPDYFMNVAVPIRFDLFK